MNSSDVAEVEELSEPGFIHHADCTKCFYLWALQCILRLSGSFLFNYLLLFNYKITF